MTKQDDKSVHERLARALRMAKTFAHTPNAVTQWHADVGFISAALSIDNPRFDRVRFERACLADAGGTGVAAGCTRLPEVG